MSSQERRRLEQANAGKKAWKKWGPYLSERQWGTVREDYSENGDAWGYFSHQQSRSRAYRWGEDGIAGISDDKQLLCFAVSLWNGKDPILKERLFGLTNSEGNHGEDVKEYYFYLDNTPTHSYMKMLYKYPQAEFPYADLVNTNKGRSKAEAEYELLDTGVFNQDRYFDVFVEYAKTDPDDILIQISVANRGTENASIRVLPTLWFRNTWSWDQSEQVRPMLAGADAVRATHPELGEYRLYCDGPHSLLFTDNETNHAKLFGGEDAYPYVKDGINDHVISGATTVNEDNVGTKMAADYNLTVAAGKTEVVRLRLTTKIFGPDGAPFAEFDKQIDQRQTEADEFYASLLPGELSEDEHRVIRQGLAGMLWSKQYYSYDVGRWLQEHNQAGCCPRNSAWAHMANADIISMPDKWEYPWYATWDLAFHTIPLVLVDEAFAKQQLLLFLDQRYMHPNGQLPAYEWNFSDVNPPVHAFAVLTMNMIDTAINDGKQDTAFLKRAFDRLVLNFNWWLTAKDPQGNNLFEGGFLGLDNIGVFDRSAALPTGGILEQSDGTAWMALFSQTMLRMALILAKEDSQYEDQALNFLEHFINIAGAMDSVAGSDASLWDEEDGFFYDVLRFPDGSGTPLKIRSLVGLLPLCSSSVIEADTLNKLPRFKKRYERLLDQHGELTKNIACPAEPGQQGRRLLSVVSETKLRRVLSRMLDEGEFLSEYGIRSLSRYHADHPYHFDWNGETYGVGYLPGESDSGMFGGNSNWRGPIWFPMNFLILRSLVNLYTYYGDTFRIACPIGSDNEMTLFEVGQEITRRLSRIFTRNSAGNRPLYGGSDVFQSDPHWRDYILFYEYFHGDNGAGIGASHQTGWTGLISPLLVIVGGLKPRALLKDGTEAATEVAAKAVE